MKLIPNKLSTTDEFIYFLFLYLVEDLCKTTRELRHSKLKTKFEALKGSEKEDKRRSPRNVVFADDWLLSSRLPPPANLNQ